MAWESPYLTPGDVPRLVFPKTAQATRALILALSEHPEGYPLHDLGSLLPDVTEQNRAAAVEAALRYLLAFAWCHVDAGLAMVGLLPRVALRAAGPASSPEAVPVAEAFDAPIRMADMTTLLVEAGAEPLPLRGHDGAFYVRTQKALGALLVPIPAWLEATAFSAASRHRETQVDPHTEVEDGDPAANVSRLEAAKSTLVHFQLASVDEANGRYRLAPTAAGRAWLVLPPGERLKHLLDVLRVSDQRTPDAYAAGGVRDFFPSGFPFRLRSGVDLRRRLCAAFLEAEDAFVPVTGWTLHHAQSRNPLLEGDEPAVSVENWWGEPITRDMLEDAWFSVLHHFLILRLLPYGGARMGRMEDGDVAFSVTPVGHYLLGATDELVYETGTEGEVVVQPDFEVVFLSPAPRLEVEMVRFAERTGTGVGALFRITRASVLRAAEQGLTTEQVLATLGAVSRTDLPANVARQIRDWIGATRHVRIRPTVLLECPDADTALRIKAFGGDSVTTITPTLLRLDDSPAATKTLVKRIREKGIFVTEVSGAGE